MLSVVAAKNFFRVSDRAGGQLQSHCFQASDAFNKQQWINCIRQAKEAAALSSDSPQGMEKRLEAGQTGTAGETEGNLYAGGAQSAWLEMEMGRCLDKAGSQSATEKAGEPAEVDSAETGSGSGGALGLDDGMDLRAEMDTEQLGCSEARADVELEAKPDALADWKMDGGAEAGRSSSTAPCREEEERGMEEEQVVDSQEVGMDTSEGGSVQCEELIQRC